ncbi:MAG: hypothetical protein ABEJ81_00995 [Haloferacaceae archaeon]
MCHHVETADHERVMELAAEWEEWKREQEAAEGETGDPVEDPEDPLAAPADD